MKFTLKEYLLLEDVFAKNGELFAAVNPDTRPKASTETTISTNLRQLGHSSSLTGGDTVFYAFTYKPSDTSTELLKSIKGKGPFQMSDQRLGKFLDDTTSHMAAEFKKIGVTPGVIVTPQSSSTLTAEFAEMLADKMNVAARKIGAFKKAKAIELSDDKEEAYKQIMAKYLDADAIAAKFAGDPAQMEREVAQAIYRSIKRNGHIVAKELNKMYLKFVKGFVDSDLHGDDEYSLMDKDVMVVDDVLSSGGTMTDLFRVSRSLGAASVVGACLFARTAQSKAKP